MLYAITPRKFFSKVGNLPNSQGLHKMGAAIRIDLNKVWKLFRAKRKMGDIQINLKINNDADARQDSRSLSRIYQH
jgi:hypothetical protein